MSSVPTQPEATTIHQQLEAEQAVMQGAMAPLADLVAQVTGSLEQPRAGIHSSLPYRIGAHWYIRRRAAGGNLPQLCRRPADTGDDAWCPPVPEDDPDGWQVLVDPADQAQETGYADVAALAPSPDGRLVAFTLDSTGADVYDLVVLDGATALEIDRVCDVCPRFAWWPDGSALAYSTVDATLRPDAVLVHRLGTAVQDDVVAFREPDPARWVGVGASTSGRMLLILSGATTSTEWWTLDGAPEAPQAHLVLPREHGVTHQVEHARLGIEDVLLVVRSKRGQPDVLASLPMPAGSAPTAEPTTLLHGNDRLQLCHLSASAAAVVLNVREDGVPCARVYRTDDASAKHLDDPALVLPSALGSRPQDWHQPFVRVTRMSWVEPIQLLDVDVRTGRQTVRRTGSVPLGYRNDEYRVHHLEVPSDGVLVPLTVIERHGQSRPAPLVLTGYGAYGQCEDPALDLTRVELLDRGVRVAVAHPRGGGELGTDWHDGARGVHKGRTIDDLLACARYLLDHGWTTPAGLVLRGASAGGLAVAAAVNRAPELFAGVVAQVPFVDPLRAMLDPSLPLTTIEREEWGDPLADPAVLAAMTAYSPAQNVRPLSYPPMFVTTSALDQRVRAEHVLSWVARVRAVGTARGPVLVRGLQSGGHSGPSDPGQQVHEQALLLAWILATVSGRSRAARGGTRAQPPR